MPLEDSFSNTIKFRMGVNPNDFSSEKLCGLFSFPNWISLNFSPATLISSSSHKGGLVVKITYKGEQQVIKQYSGIDAASRTKKK